MKAFHMLFRSNLRLNWIRNELSIWTYKDNVNVIRFEKKKEQDRILIMIVSLLN